MTKLPLKEQLIAPRKTHFQPRVLYSNNAENLRVSRTAQTFLWKGATEKLSLNNLCPPPSEMLTLEATRIAEDVDLGVKGSVYSHLNRRIETFYAFNCYGFLNHCLEKTVPAAFFEIVRAMHRMQETVPASFDGTPCPYNYAIIWARSRLMYWQRILNLEDIRRGDVIVYLPRNYSPLTCPSQLTRERTGTHMMVVQDTYGARNRRYAFSVIDCTRKAHCELDSRHPGGSGIGFSPLHLTPVEGSIYNLQWSPCNKGIEKRVIVGRLKGD